MPTVRRNDVTLELTICPCGSVFLTYGALTANFSVEEFFAFADKGHSHGERGQESERHGTFEAVLDRLELRKEL